MQKQKIHFRRAYESEADILEKFDRICFPESAYDIVRYDREILGRFIKSHSYDVILAIEGDNRLVGYAIIDQAKKSLPEVRLESIGIHPRARGKGIGRQLLIRAEKNARRLGARSIKLECWEKNRIGLKLYRRMGYSFIKRGEGYADKSVALEFRKNFLSVLAQAPHHPTGHKSVRPMCLAGRPVHL